MVLYGAAGRHTFSAANLCGPLGPGWELYGFSGDEASTSQRTSSPFREGQKGELVRSRSGDQVPPLARTSSGGETEAVSAPDSHGDLCARANYSRRTGPHRWETDYQSAGLLAARSLRKADLVCVSLENRDVPQNSPIWLPSRTGEAAHGRSISEPYFCILYSELAHFLADQEQPSDTGGLALTGPNSP